MITEQEKLQHEAIKVLMKQTVLANPKLTDYQKRMAIDNIDRAAQKADWIIEMIRMCGYYS